MCLIGERTSDGVHFHIVMHNLSCFLKSTFLSCISALCVIPYQSELHEVQGSKHSPDNRKYESQFQCVFKCLEAP